MYILPMLPHIDDLLILKQKQCYKCKEIILVIRRGCHHSYEAAFVVHRCKQG